MTHKLSSVYFNPATSTSLLTTTLVDKIVQHDFLKQACEAVIESLVSKQQPPPQSSIAFEEAAKTCIIEHMYDLIKILCIPTLAVSLSELCSRVNHSLPEKLRPSQKYLDEFRIAAERGKRRQFCIPADKLISQLKAADGRIDTSTAIFFAMLIESILTYIVQTTLNYRSKITKTSESITVTDIKHIFSLLGIMDAPGGTMKTSLPFINRRPSSYEDCLKELQFFLSASGDQLAIIIRIFFEPLSAILSDLSRSHRPSLEHGCSPESMEQYLRCTSFISVARVASIASAVFTSAKSLFSDMSILSEVADDVFDSTTHMLKYCLQEPAEEDLFQGFAYYAETFLSENCHDWLQTLSETPAVYFALFRCHRHMVKVILEQVSVRRAPEMELRFADPHACQLCRSVNEYVSHDLRQQHSSNTLSTSAASSCEGSLPTPPPSDTTSSLDPVSQNSLNGNLFSRHQGPFRKHSSNRAQEPRQMACRLSPQLHLVEGASWGSSGSPSPPQGVNSIYLSSSASSSFIDGSSPPAANLIGTSFSVSPPATFAAVTQPLCEQRTEAPFAGGSKTCNQMVIAFRYLLPRLLLMPIYQILYLADLLDTLCSFNSANEQEQSILRDVLSMLYKTRKSVTQHLSSSVVEQWASVHLPRLSTLLETPLTYKPAFMLSPDARGKLDEVIECARASSEAADCRVSENDFVMSGILQVRPNFSRPEVADRIAYLFSDCLLLCKRYPQPRRGLGTVAMAAAAAAATVSSSSASGSLANSAAASLGALAAGGISLKKCIPLSHFHLIDLGVEALDNCETVFLFELEYWKEVIVTKRPTPSAAIAVPLHHQSQTTITGSSATLPKQGSATSLSTLTSTGSESRTHQRLCGSSTTLTSLAAAAAAAGDFEESAPSSSASPTKRVIFCFRTGNEKADWVGAMIALQTKRLFSRYIRELPKQEVPLILPGPDQYCFTKPDTADSIQFAKQRADSSIEIPVIKAATIHKLIERMTYHAYFDSNSIRTFLQTYRRYLSASELLQLLVTRFQMPRPDFEGALQAAMKAQKSFSDVASLIPRMELRYQSAYKRRVQYRVLSLITKWIKDSAYFKRDFSTDPALRNRLVEFLDTIDTPALVDSVSSITKCLRGERTRVVHTITLKPPERLDLGLVARSDQIRLTNVHPLELARQVTLHEWSLYSKIEFWEVNGKEKIDAPNLNHSVEFSNKFQWWLVLNIMSQELMDSRILALQRVADLLVCFEALNNFQGAQEARAALLSPPVFRLRDTFDVLMSKSKPHYRTLFQQLRDSETDVARDADAYMTDYQRRIHCIDPPAVPFIAVCGRTQLIHLELKAPDYIYPAKSPDSNDSAVLGLETITRPLSSENFNCADLSDVAFSEAAEADSEDQFRQQELDSREPQSLPAHSDVEQKQAQQATPLLINFVKCQQIADLVEHYLSFQNTPFNLQPDPIIQVFCETLDPLGLADVADESTFEDLMYQQSLEVQACDSRGLVPGSQGDFRHGEVNSATQRFIWCRSLSSTEYRIGTLLSSVPIDVSTTMADAKEFRQLAAIAAASGEPTLTVDEVHGSSFVHFYRRDRGSNSSSLHHQVDSLVAPLPSILNASVSPIISSKNSSVNSLPSPDRRHYMRRNSGSPTNSSPPLPPHARSSSSVGAPINRRSNLASPLTPPPLPPRSCARPSVPQLLTDPNPDNGLPDGESWPSVACDCVECALGIPPPLTVDPSCSRSPSPISPRLPPPKRLVLVDSELFDNASCHHGSLMRHAAGQQPSFSHDAALNWSGVISDRLANTASAPPTCVGKCPTDNSFSVTCQPAPPPRPPKPSSLVSVWRPGSGTAGNNSDQGDLAHSPQTNSLSESPPSLPPRCNAARNLHASANVIGCDDSADARLPPPLPPRTQHPLPSRKGAH